MWESDPSAYVNAVRGTSDPLRHRLLIPTLMELVGDVDDALVLDIGCGDGVIAALVVERGAREVVGLDVSEAMIRRCRARGIRALRCYHHDIQRGSLDIQADICIANMVLHLIPNLPDAVANLRAMLRTDSTVIASIPHPAFHMETAQVEALSEFRSARGIPAWFPSETYDTEHRVVNTFGQPSVRIPMFHRALGYYADIFCRSGFVIERLVEPVFRGSLEEPLAVWRHLPPFAFLRVRRT